MNHSKDIPGNDEELVTVASIGAVSGEVDKEEKDFLEDQKRANYHSSLSERMKKRRQQYSFRVTNNHCSRKASVYIKEASQWASLAEKEVTKTIGMEAKVTSTIPPAAGLTKAMHIHGKYKKEKGHVSFVDVEYRKSQHFKVNDNKLVELKILVLKEGHSEKEVYHEVGFVNIFDAILLARMQ